MGEYIYSYQIFNIIYILIHIYDDTMTALTKIADGRPIFDIRFDRQTNNWREAYDRVLSISKKLNQSRIYRRESLRTVADTK